MSICTVVLGVEDSHQMGKVVDFMTAAGIQIDAINETLGVIECTGEANMMRGLEHAKLFGYLRVTMTYAAEFPKGHPLDTNGK